MNGNQNKKKITVIKKTFYSFATAILLLATAIFSTVKASEKTNPPSSKIVIAAFAGIPRDTCDQLFFIQDENGNQTTKHLCDLQVNATKLNLAFFNISDDAINNLFKDETTMKLKDEHNADIVVNHQF